MKFGEFMLWMLYIACLCFLLVTVGIVVVPIIVVLAMFWLILRWIFS